MNKAQLIIIGVGVLLVAGLFRYGRKAAKPSEIKAQVQAEIQVKDPELKDLTAQMLASAKLQLTPQQREKLKELEDLVTKKYIDSVYTEAGKIKMLTVIHQLAHYWKDSLKMFEPYAWYEAEAARLENSEKSLTFAAHLLLEDLRQENDHGLKRWKALEARDLFERSLKINDKNDSTIVGLSATKIFGGIADNPMAEIMNVSQLVKNDSTNVFALVVLGDGAMMTEQYDVAIKRFGTVVDLQPKNLKAILRIAEAYEKKADTANAIKWYSNALPVAGHPNMKTDLATRIKQLKK